MAGIVSFLNYLQGAGPKEWEFRSGRTTSYASAEEREANAEYDREQRAKGGSAGQAGWNSVALNLRQEAASTNYSSRTNIAGGRLEGQRRSTSWSPTASLMGTGGGIGGSVATSGVTKAHTRESYPLGAPSLAWWDKFERWGPEGPRGNRGWEGTLIPPAIPRSTIATSQRIEKELVQTRETRRKGGNKPFTYLKKHVYAPRLNHSLANMYRRKGVEIGSVRRVTRKIF